MNQWWKIAVLIAPYPCFSFAKIANPFRTSTRRRHEVSQKNSLSRVSWNFAQKKDFTDFTSFPSCSGRDCKKKFIRSDSNWLPGKWNRTFIFSFLVLYMVHFSGWNCKKWIFGSPLLSFLCRSTSLPFLQIQPAYMTFLRNTRVRPWGTWHGVSSFVDWLISYFQDSGDSMYSNSCRMWGFLILLTRQACIGLLNLGCGHWGLEAIAHLQIKPYLHTKLMFCRSRPDADEGEENLVQGEDDGDGSQSSDGED